MSEKKNFTENQILDLGKISPVEKGGISHSILVALEKDLKGKDIKDIENFYKNNISLDAQKAILKISMEVEKNQIPENRRKKGNYKIVYKTDNIDLGKLKKTEEKPKEEVKIENPKVESTKTENNSTNTDAFKMTKHEKEIRQASKEVQQIIENEKKSNEGNNSEFIPVAPITTNTDAFKMTKHEKEIRQASKEVQQIIENEKKSNEGNNSETKEKITDKKTITDIDFLYLFEELNLDFTGIWKQEDKSREDFVKEFKNLVIQKEGNFNYDFEDIRGTLNSFYERGQNIDYGYRYDNNKKQIEIEKFYSNLKSYKNATNTIKEAEKDLN